MLTLLESANLPSASSLPSWEREEDLRKDHPHLFSSQPESRGRDSSKGGQVCNIPIFNLDVIQRSFICIHDLCILLLYFSCILIQEALSNSRTNLRELEDSQKSKVDLSKFGKLDQIVFSKFFSNYFKIKREDKMTSSKSAKKYWKLNFEFLDILFDFICQFIYLFAE